MKKCFIVFIGVLLLSLELSASHISGVDISYTWLNGNTYKITVSYYRDCRGVTSITGGKVPFNGTCTAIQTSFSNVPGTLLFSYYSPTCGLCAQDTFPTSSLVKSPVSLICASMTSTCQDTSSVIPGYEKWTFSKNVTFPTQCSDWTICFEAPTRNAYETTISNPTGQNSYVTAVINNLDAPGSSSPVFNSPNVAYLCAGKVDCYNQGAVDPNGDSLVYSLFEPISIPGTPGSYLAYNAGYSYTSPFGAGSPMTLNAQTGAICVTPALQLITVTDIQVSKYRNGVLIGSVVRDLQFVVIPCNNDMPIVSGINNAAYASNHIDSVCAGQQLCFNINGTDPDVSDSVTMTWDNSINTAAFNVTNNGTKTPVGQFCWTPSIADTSVTPHSFTVTVHDNACPYEGIQYFPFSVYVNSCSVAVLPPVAHFQSSDSTICTNDCINFTDLSTNSPTSWLWTFQGAMPPTSTAQNPSFVCYQNSGDFQVTLVVSNSSGSDTKTLTNLIHVIASPTPPTITQFGDSLVSSFDPSYTSYQWYDSAGIINGATHIYYIAHHSGNFNVKVTNENGCISATGINIVLGLNNFSSDRSISLFPNPAHNELIINGLLPELNTTVAIFNAMGQAMQVALIKSTENRINIKDLSAGIYFIQIANERNRWLMKFIKE